HPHIVPIHSVGEGPDGLVYFVMAYVDGESLGAKLKRRGRLPPDEARRIMQETADALGAAHAFGIIHRDVKPDNILLEGSRGRVVVTDFGIAKALSSTTGGATLTATGVAIGTPHYMSPEQAAGDREIDGRSDIYSLGVVTYHMLAGELPFHAPSLQGLLIHPVAGRRPQRRARDRARAAQPIRHLGLGVRIPVHHRCRHGQPYARVVALRGGGLGWHRARPPLHPAVARRLFVARRLRPATGAGRDGSPSRRGGEPPRRPAARDDRRVRRPRRADPAGPQRSQGHSAGRGSSPQVGAEAAARRDRDHGCAPESG